MQDYIDHLAVNVLNEGQTISYRGLSRALKVHSNVAKQMLYDFHHKQNKKKPGTLHATYLITGRQKQRQAASTNGVQSQESQGTNMRSSPFPSSSMPEPRQAEENVKWIRLVTLAKEEDLEDAKAQLDELISVHIYSLEPGTIKDLQILTDCNRRIAAEYASEDPSQIWKQSGTIQNANVKRRTARKQPPPAQAAAAARPPAKPTTHVKVTTHKPAIAKAVKEEQQKVEKEVKSEAAQVQAPSSRRTESTSKPPANVRRESSNIFKSFAKAKPKKPKTTEQQGSKESTPAPETAADEPTGTLSDEDGDGDATMLDEESSKEVSGPSKKDREAELRKMMDVEDESMDDAPSNPIDATPESSVAGSQQQQPTEPEPTETVTVTNGRRRGRRRVMKKKTVKDEEGYLVTKEEAAWESFSEEEPAPKRTKMQPVAQSNTNAATTATAANKAKKGGGGGKPGQGNIMSFFSKK